MRRAVMHRIHHELHDTRAIAQIDKDKAAMIAPRLDPSPERNLAADVSGTNLSAQVSPLPRWKRRILLSFRHHTSQVEFLAAGRRIAVPASTRNSQFLRAAAIELASSASRTSRCELFFRSRSWTTPRASSSSPMIPPKRAPSFEARPGTALPLASAA